jgi:hypothetical protein
MSSVPESWFVFVLQSPTRHKQLNALPDEYQTIPPDLTGHGQRFVGKK